MIALPTEYFEVAHHRGLPPRLDDIGFSANTTKQRCNIPELLPVFVSRRDRLHTLWPRDGLAPIARTVTI
jgi:hypothetical protein